MRTEQWDAFVDVDQLVTLVVFTSGYPANRLRLKPEEARQLGEDLIRLAGGRGGRDDYGGRDQLPPTSREEE